MLARALPVAPIGYRLCRLTAFVSVKPGSTTRQRNPQYDCVRGVVYELPVAFGYVPGAWAKRAGVYMRKLSSIEEIKEIMRLHLF